MLLKFKMMLSVLFSILFFSGTAFPQNDSIVQAESSLVAILKECRLAKNDSLRLALNDRFAEMLATTLDLPQSRLSPFDSLNIGKLTSTDGKIRIFNWNIQQNDRSNIYSIIIQNIAKDTIIRLKTIASRRVLDENTVYKNGDWPGGLFYLLIEREETEHIYTLLSWDGYRADASRKTIESLSFDSKGMPVFGAPVFKTKNGLQNRVVNEYYSQSAFTLHYDQQKIALSNVRRSQRKIDDKMIVLDRLIPMNPELEGQKWAYVPAGNIYDAYIFLNGFWTFVEGIEPRNPAPAIEKGKAPKKEIYYDLFPPKD
ncbi:MAG: hypothetical protein RBS07_08670 [Lentimicrobium sp.]|jgi:hypothetical protein|nr:hypothetical protein [Lentimicrobium sp.]